MKACVVNPSHHLDPRSLIKQGTPIFRCAQCGCIMADIGFDHGQYESGNYYTLKRKTLADIDEEWGFRWRYILRRIAATGHPASLLDVGAGNGYFVRVAAREFGLRASGLEISAEETRFARETVGVALINRDVSDHRQRYDVVTSFNVLEHVPHPQAFLSALVARVQPGGLLVLTTPNPGCIHARVRGLEKWNMVDPPHHLNLFSRRALHDLLRARNLEVLRYETLSTYVNCVRRFDTEGLLLRRAVFQLLRWSHLGADHFVVARKPARIGSSPADALRIAEVDEATS